MKIEGEEGNKNTMLVGGFNPLKNISQNGNLPQVGVEKGGIFHLPIYLEPRGRVKLPDILANAWEPTVPNI